MEPRHSTVVVNLNELVPDLGNQAAASEVVNLRDAVIAPPHRNSNRSRARVETDLVELENESLDQVSIRMYVAPEHRHSSDVALLQMSIGFFSGLRNFSEKLEQIPDATMGFRSTPQPKIDMGEYLGRAKAISQFCTSYVFTIDAPTKEDSIKRKIALDCASVAEGFTRAVKSVTNDILVTKDTAGYMSGIFAETSQAMRILVTQLSMMMLGGGTASYLADEE